MVGGGRVEVSPITQDRGRPERTLDAEMKSFLKYTLLEQQLTTLESYYNLNNTTVREWALRQTKC